jgi:hypothetical protein
MSAWWVLIGLTMAAQAAEEPPPPPPPVVDELDAFDDIDEPDAPPGTMVDEDVNDADANKASGEPGKRSAEERAVIQPGSVAALYGLMTIPAMVGGCVTGLSPCFVLVGPQALFLTCGTACGIMGFFPVVQGVMGWLISDALLGIASDLMWIMVGAYGACVIVMPIALLVGLGLGLAGIIEVGNLNNGFGWSYGPFLPQPDPTSLLVGSLVVPVGVMLMGAMAQTVGPTAAAVLTAQAPQAVAPVPTETPPSRRRRQAMRF